MTVLKTKIGWSLKHSGKIRILVDFSFILTISFIFVVFIPVYFLIVCQVWEACLPCSPFCPAPTYWSSSCLFQRLQAWHWNSRWRRRSFRNNIQSTVKSDSENGNKVYLTICLYTYIFTLKYIRRELFYIFCCLTKVYYRNQY